MSDKDTFFSQDKCDRCGKELVVRIMSWFTRETICMECVDKEEEIKRKLEGKHEGTLEDIGYVPDPDNFPPKPISP